MGDSDSDQYGQLSRNSPPFLSPREAGLSEGEGLGEREKSDAVIETYGVVGVDDDELLAGRGGEKLRDGCF
jgi:hypothetical protein